MEEARAIRAVAAETGTPIFVGTMHAYDPAYRAAYAAWKATGDVPVLVRNAIYLPPNEVFTDQSTEVVSAPAAGAPAAPPAPDQGQAAMRAAMLGLAIHNLPLVRDFEPDVGRLLSAKFLSPFGYALLANASDCKIEITGFLPGEWPHKWTFEVIGHSHRLHAAMPPSYVMSGSAVVRLEGPTSTSTFQFPTNGYQALWDSIGDTVLNDAPPPISLDTAIADLSLALRFADDIDILFGSENT